MAPKDAKEMKMMFKFALDYNGPSAIRYPRGIVPEIELPSAGIVRGTGEILREGSEIALIAAGSCVMPAMQAAERLELAGVSAQVVNARFIKPLDRELLLSVAERIPMIVTIEENALEGGFGSSVLECLNDAGMNVRVKRLGIPDKFIEQAGIESLKAKYGIDEDGIFLASLSFLREHTFSN